MTGSLRVKLARAATEEEIAEGLKIGERITGVSNVMHELSMAADSGLRALGIAEDMLTNENADNLAARGEYEEARRLYESTLPGLKERDPGVWRLTVSRLAWLEKDPERAYLYLELSTTGDDAGALVFLDNAVRLSEATGSDALAALYRRRLEREKDRLRREAGR